MTILAGFSTTSRHQANLKTPLSYTQPIRFHAWEHDYQDKRWMLEQSQEATHDSLPKRIEAGQRFDTLVENVDFGPTLLISRACHSSTVQGRSFRSLLETGEEPNDWKKATYYRYWMHMAHHDNPAHVGLRTKNLNSSFIMAALRRRLSTPQAGNSMTSRTPTKLSISTTTQKTKILLQR